MTHAYDRHQEAAAGQRPAIGLLNEKPLHAALKEWYAHPGDQFEVQVGPYIVDIVRGDLLIEIQTANFAAISAKMAALVDHGPVRLVYPIPREKWIVKLTEDGGAIASRRKSPKRGKVEDVFDELVRLPCLLAHPGFSLEVLLTQEEELRRYDPSRAWRRRGWVTCERRLIDVVGQRLIASPADVRALLPPGLPEPFTTADLAEGIGGWRRLAQRMAYCLRKMGVILADGKRSNAVLYVLAEPAPGAVPGGRER